MKRDTRRAILDMAKTLFSQQGYNAVSIGAVSYTHLICHFLHCGLL